MDKQKHIQNLNYTEVVKSQLLWYGSFQTTSYVYELVCVSLYMYIHKKALFN